LTSVPNQTPNDFKREEFSLNCKPELSEPAVIFHNREKILAKDIGPRELVDLIFNTVHSELELEFAERHLRNES
jgi:hypothetical protein